MDDVSLFHTAAQPVAADHLDVHPLANIFPMLSDDELNELAADIKENGLLHPIVRMIDHKTIVDGRNRYEACHRAGIEPEFDDYIENDEQARALIVSANLQRRNMTKGQQAIAHAMIYPDPKRGMHSELSGSTRNSFDKAHLSRARAVLRASPDELAPQVLSGALTLDKAHAEVTKRQQEASSTEARFARLREMAPDLADLVIEERMTLGEAIAAANQREKERQDAIDAGRRASENLINFVSVALSIKAATELGERGLVTEEQLGRLEDAMTLLRRIYAEDDQ